MVYEKKICYLELWENGQKIEKAGFMTVRKSGEVCRFEVNVDCVGLKITGEKEVTGRAGENDMCLGMIKLTQGKGKMHLESDPNGCFLDVKADELEKIKIVCGEKEICCELKESEKGKVLQIEERKALTTLTKPVAAAEAPSELQYAGEKWDRLMELYPGIEPFGDERSYLSIGPQDFVILPEDQYRLINNSFLLHGYYNYGHMILTKVRRQEEDCFYVGVPGNYYEKERQAAIYFGFESFEGRREPVRPGDYGYYMIRVRL